ncbi:hypothetical protein SEEACDC1_04175 [Salmonella enterica subsp. enterica serovar Agona str. SA-1]|nr:hypothetical protein SEEACDC1_04175 [Salmonella enterica subsp. enterica serovar Agona str. SA-1]
MINGELNQEQFRQLQEALKKAGFASCQTSPAVVAHGEIRRGSRSKAQCAQPAVTGGG